MPLGGIKRRVPKAHHKAQRRGKRVLWEGGANARASHRPLWPGWNHRAELARDEDPSRQKPTKEWPDGQGSSPKTPGPREKANIGQLTALATG